MKIEITKEEREAGMNQLGARLTELKTLCSDSKDFKRIQELVEFIKPIQSLYNKLIIGE